MNKNNYKGHRIRLFPTKEQERKMFRYIGANRTTYNIFLDMQIKNYKKGEKRIKKYGMYGILTEIKRQEEYMWMNEISNSTLRGAINDLDYAFENFFDNEQNFPEFKTKKKSKMSFHVRTDVVSFKNELFWVEKIGHIKYRSNYKNLDLEKINKFISGSITYVKSSKKWMLSFNLERETQTFIKENDNPSMGIDLGIKELATISYGDQIIVYRNINKDKEMIQLERKLKHVDRIISRKRKMAEKEGRTEKSKRLLYYEHLRQKIYAKLTNKCDNYIHHMTKQIINENPSRVVIEDLNISGMVKNKCLSKHIWHTKFYEIRRQLEYKCEWNGILLVVAPRFYPSSKTCCKCGCIKKDLKLSDRTYVCTECGNKIDRDVNAAINLANYKG